MTVRTQPRIADPDLHRTRNENETVSGAEVAGVVVNAGGRSNTIMQYTIGPDGSLASMVTSTVAAGSSPQSVTTTGIIQ